MRQVDGSRQVDHNYHVISVDEILPGLWLGNEAASQSEQFMIKNNIKLIVNATKDIKSKFLNKIHYIRVPVGDPGKVYSVSQNEDVYVMNECLPLVLNKILAARQRGWNILIHCHAGAQRSAIIAAAYLLFRHHATDPRDATEQIVQKRNIAFFGGKSINFYDVLRTVG